MHTNVVQRFRVTFGVGGPLNYISVLDMGRLWERMLRRARMPLAYTQGYNPHPRMQFASALPVGYSSSCELADILLGQVMRRAEFEDAIRWQAPPGLTILRVEEVPIKAPSPQAGMQTAYYRVRVCSPATRSEIEAELKRLEDLTHIMRERARKGQVRSYDLRPLIQSMEYLSADGDCHILWMTLACGPQGAGRPEEILDEMQIDVSEYAIHRSRLVWKDEQEEQQ